MIVRETREATEASSTAWSFGILSGTSVDDQDDNSEHRYIADRFFELFQVRRKMKKQETSQEFFPKPVQMASAGYIFLTQWSRRVPSFLLAKLEGHVLQPMMNALNLTCPKCQCLEFSEFPGASKSEKWQDPHLAGHLRKLPADDGMLDQLLPDRWVMSHRKLLGLSDTRKMQKT